ncbi:hypothetical protein PN466_13565 [Roseofilum reptotaenium CS-1145]|uniref:Uncharacterized protein n=1 Tax=Roseofilum reptotaenium AO1-A TaxID=1925591 RepID=A0A1L9QWE7_9CYAN|nr:hypothetical protein [Roseofilum reptotaenium]MDB9517977.1 hypothetical protein [Roseofilum reptotaenium CS-1145]OJJ26932.1 hypothetical protein BI308_04395 [Roseofilum reptotaenium AO1-A]
MKLWKAITDGEAIEAIASHFQCIIKQEQFINSQMTEQSIQLNIPFDSLVNAITALEIEEKVKLFNLLETEISQLEEDQLEDDPTVLQEIEGARMAYRTGDYQTLGQYQMQNDSKFSDQAMIQQQLEIMAYDPEIQQELAAIDREFNGVEWDGLA